MNIGLISQEYPPDTARGGIGSQTWNKARALAALGHNVHVLSSAAQRGPDPAISTHDGVTVYRMQTPGTDFPVYSQAAYWLGYSWSVLRHLSALITNARLDVVDVAEYGGEAYAYLLDRSPWNWVPVVVQLHGPLALFSAKLGWPEPGSDLFRTGTMMEALCIRRADALMACSGAIADFTAADCGVARAAIDVVHCGVDAASFTPGAQPATARAPQRPTVLFVGNLAANKGVLTTLRAVLALRARYPDILLRLAGKGDDDIQRRAEREVAAASATGNVEFLGFAGRDQLPAHYRAASVFCSPAQYECGVANTFIEAMGCGCPVIASTAGGAPEAVIDGRTGFLVPPDDVAATTAALDRVLGNPELQAAMRIASRRRVEAYFSMDHYIRRVLAVYERAIVRSHQLRAQREAEA